MDECKVTSVHSTDPDTEVVLMDADDNYIKEDQLEEHHKKETEGMTKIPMKEVKIT